MRLVVHDFVAHPFQVDLSRELAERGHEVLQLYCASFLSPPGGANPRPDDAPSLEIEGLSIGRAFNRYSAKQRGIDEIAYGRVAAARVKAFDPQAVLSGGTALLSQHALLREARRARRRFIYWWQDSYGIGVGNVIRRRFPAAGRAAAWPFERYEARLLSRSDHVVAISDGMRDIALQWGVDGQKLSVIRNWAPLSEFLPQATEESWRAAHGLTDLPVVLYAGTLGLKHNPELLAGLATEGQAKGFRVVVMSEGPGRDYLESAKQERSLSNLTLMDFDSPAKLAGIQAEADALVVILEPDAGAFSVPSKVFSYLCAGRPILGAVPSDNQAAEVLRTSGAGICVEPTDADGLRRAAARLLADPEEGERMGKQGRHYALENFDRAKITDRFETLLGIGQQNGSERDAPR